MRRRTQVRLINNKNGSIPVAPQALALPPGPPAHVPGSSQFSTPPESTVAVPGSTVINLVVEVLMVMVAEAAEVTVAVMGILSATAPSLMYVCGTTKADDVAPSPKSQPIACRVPGSEVASTLSSTAKGDFPLETFESGVLGNPTMICNSPEVDPLVDSPDP